MFDIIDGYMRPLPFLAQSVISTLFISIVPIFMIYAMNIVFLHNAETRESFMYLLLSFAMGGLLGDVFFHTIPHLSGGEHSHDHGHSHSHTDHDHTHIDTHDHHHDHHHHDHHDHGHSEADMQMSLYIVGGIWCFFLLEKITSTYF